MCGLDGTVDISDKTPTARTARARSVVHARADVVRDMRNNDLAKRDPLPTARSAAMLAVKKTPHLLPHCHPVNVTDITVEFRVGNDSITITCTVRAADRTGPDLEALTGASTAALTLYDMMKSTCPEASIEDTRLLEKRGGRTGHWRAEGEETDE